MVATTFTTQRQLTRKNMPKSALEGPMARQQQLIMYALPFVFILTGPNFPIGVLIYWTTTNLWTMGQQYYVIKRNPTPGSEAERTYLAKKEAKQLEHAIRRGETTLEQIEAEKAAAIEAARGQRVQPKKGAPRAKRAPGAKPLEITNGDDRRPPMTTASLTPRSSNRQPKTRPPQTRPPQPRRPRPRPSASRVQGRRRSDPRSNNHDRRHRTRTARRRG